MIRVTGKLPERGVSGCSGTTLSPQIHFHGGNQDLYDGFIVMERYESGCLQTPFLFSIAMLSQIENISVTRLKRQNNTMINGGSRKQLSL